MDKRSLMTCLLSAFEEELQALTQIVDSAQTAATDGEVVAEDRYDTRAIESAYLAGAQQARLGELRTIYAIYKQLPLREFDEDDEIEALAVVRLEGEPGPRSYFIGPQGGGLKVTVEGEEVMVITPPSPLGKQLMGKEVGDEVTIKVAGADQFFEIIEIA